MKIKKIGHCCLSVQVEGVTILTDPGAFSAGQDSITGIDAILITHEHADHLHVESLSRVLVNNPQARIICNEGVSRMLTEKGIPHETVSHGDIADVNRVNVLAHECKHEEIFEEMGQVQNTGFMIADRLFYPGDAFADPGIDVDVLALPVAGPWCRVADAINYALRLRPKKAFPVHDGMLHPDRIGAAHRIPEKVLGENGIEFVAMTDGEEREF